MSDSPSPAHSLVRLTLKDLRVCWGALLTFEIAFALVAALVLTPLLAWVTALLMNAAGRTAVSNNDVLAFLGTPAGLALAACLGIGTLAGTLLEQAGLMRVAALKKSGQRTSPRRILVTVAAGIERVVRLGVVQLAALLVVFAPLAVAGAGIYFLLLSQHDINYYLTDRPPVFWIAGVAAGLLGLAGLILAAWLYVRWSLALPLLLFERRLATSALRESARRVRGAGWRIAAVLLGWQLLGFLAGAGLLWGGKWLAREMLGAVENRPSAIVPLVVLLLALHGLALAVLHFLVAAVNCLLVMRFWTERGGQDFAPASETAPAPSEDEELPARSWPARIAWGLALLLLAMTPFVGVTLGLARRPRANEHVAITAHRGYSRAAPENTLAAVRRAAEVGADFAEIDVQETADGEIVLIHDADLMRLADVRKSVAQMTLAEIRQVDVGRKFSPAFAGERLPTLREVIAFARDRIRLNIELKYYGKDRGLAAKVARLIRDENFEDQCVVMSLDYDAVMEAKRHNPRLKTGHIVAYAVGNLSQLDVDVLSIRADLLSDRLLRAARRQGKQIHVWTVNDPRAMVRVRREREELNDVERLVLTARHLLGLGP